MKIETQRLFIRDVKTEDEIPFVKMAADGSLNDCGFDKDCGDWMAKWIDEAKNFAYRNNPHTDYLAYTITLKDEAVVIGSVGCSYYEEFQQTGITYFIGEQYRSNGYAVEAVKAYTEYFLNHYDVKGMIATVRDENIPSWKVIEKVGFILNGKRMYKDLNDDEEQLYRFYEITK
ncbi:MAG: GNAT family N-acetyltransferase [Butyrivibrio sp.]|nr:GNAT family N-acetyltransferase [Butyrivibrio sp.]